ncbi:protein ARK2N-like isoform X2 [Carassius carassius]|uniref:protein ARK2N-like isoform X2 n=1 Tax=Carassius carassius TaxID=217509 RepID=UPI0028684F0D|nr:protein ARK2N-like isoform X2 [Carassius carassius]
MTDAQKANELPECTTEGGATTEEQDMSLRQETTPTSSPTCEEPISSPDKQPAPSLLSMPCLLDELHRDSAAGQPQETDPPLAANQSCAREDSDSSVCQRSPSSSGNLGDSDSSAEEAPAPVQTAGRKSRRSHSESDTPSVTMAAKKNRCHQKQVNGRVRVRAPRSQQQKQRMRQLRQKREAAVRRKPDVLQDSSTSDSDITAHSSSSSPLTASSDNDGERVNSHAPVGPAVIGHYDISDTHSEQEQQSQSLSGAVPAVEVQPSQVSLASTDSEVEIVGVQENAGVVSRFPHGGVIQSLSSWKQRAPAQWTSVSAQSVWVPPPEVVDLTLDEDRHRYLL